MSIFQKISLGTIPRTALNNGRVGRAGMRKEGMERLRMKEWAKGEKRRGSRRKEGMVKKGMRKEGRSEELGEKRRDRRIGREGRKERERNTPSAPLLNPGFAAASKPDQMCKNTTKKFNYVQIMFMSLVTRDGKSIRR